MRKVKSTLNIERSTGNLNAEGEEIFEEIEVEILGYYSPFHKGPFEKGGGQISPDEEARLEDIEATYNGKVFELTQEEMEKAEAELLDQVSNDGCYEPEPDDDRDDY